MRSYAKLIWSTRYKTKRYLKTCEMPSLRLPLRSISLTLFRFQWVKKTSKISCHYFPILTNSKKCWVIGRSIWKMNRYQSINRLHLLQIVSRQSSISSVMSSLSLEATACKHEMSSKNLLQRKQRSKLKRSSAVMRMKTPLKSFSGTKWKSTNGYNVCHR